MKEPKCSFCKETGHYRIQCFKAPRATIKSTPKPLLRAPVRRSPIKTPTNPIKRKPIASKPVARRKQLVAELDRVFSLFIRRKDAINGLARCVTCGERNHYKHMDNGHFISRGKMGTRFSEVNCHVQCRECNRIKSGNPIRYKQYMLATYGEKAVAELIIKSRQTIPTYEIEALIKYYKEKLFTLPE